MHLDAGQPAPTRNRPALGKGWRCTSSSSPQPAGTSTATSTDLLREIPAHPDDTDWISPLDFLFDDYDVLTLFDPKPVSGGVNLDPEDLFVPFEDHTARDADRGYRR